MRTIFGIGEALLDIIFKNDQPINAIAGGSTLNAMVSLGRMDYSPQLISEIGNDRMGDLINNFLVKNSVSNKYLFRKKGNRSPLALAFLNDNNDAEYEIFKDYSAQSLSGDMPKFKENDLLLFGSFFALNPALREQLVKILEEARNQGVLIIYDPNYRNHHAHRTDELKQAIEKNFSLAHIVRGSDEDFKNIFGLNTVQEMAQEINRFCPNAIITANSKGVYLSTENSQRWYPALPIKTVSTIGAGDNFNAGLAHGIIQEKVLTSNLNQLPETEWTKIVASAVAFSAEVCCSTENYVPTNFAKKQNHHVQKFYQLLKQSE